MNEVKVRITREQLNSALGGHVEVRHYTYSDSCAQIFTSNLPEEFTLSLPADQVEGLVVPAAKLRTATEAMDKATEEYLAAREHGKLHEPKRKRYLAKVKEKVRISPEDSWDIIELEEVDP